MVVAGVVRPWLVWFGMPGLGHGDMPQEQWVHVQAIGMPTHPPPFDVAGHG